MKVFLYPIYTKSFLSALFIASVGYANLTNAAPNQANSKEDLIAVQNAWVRPTAAGQDVGAAYMTLTSTQNVDLLSVESNVTKSVEIHSMTMDKGIMKMRMLDKLNLVAGKPYKLEPGGFHLMLFDLKKPLVLDDQVSFVLNFEVKTGKKPHTILQQTVKATVQSSAENSPASTHKQ